MRLLTLLCVLLLVNACTNLETNTEDQPITKKEQITPLAEDKEAPKTVIEEKVEKEVEPTPTTEPIQKKEPAPTIKKTKKVKKKPVQIDQPVEKATVEVVEAQEETVEINDPNIIVAPNENTEPAIVEVGGFDEKERESVDEILNLLRKKFIEAEEEEDEEGIIGFATTTVDSNAIVSSEDSSAVSDIATKGGTAAKTAVKRGAFDEVIEAERTDQIFGERKEIAKSEIEFVRKPKILQKYYSGYKIELMTVYNKALELDDELFKTFGGLTFVKEGNKTVYYLGDFKTKKALEDFLEKVVISRFPEAKGAKFTDGIAGKY